MHGRQNEMSSGYSLCLRGAGSAGCGSVISFAFRYRNRARTVKSNFLFVSSAAASTRYEVRLRMERQGGVQL